MAEGRFVFPRSNLITVVVPTSPIPTHPFTSILEETLDSVRYHLPDAPIIVTFDGVQTIHQKMVHKYDEYMRRALWLIDHKYVNIIPKIFTEHHHQSGMMFKTFPLITTPYLMYVEHDTPLTIEKTIDWSVILWLLESKLSSLVRFHHEAVIPEEHNYLMHGREGALPFVRTSQWSQRPHISPTEWYRREVMVENFKPEDRTFIEDVMHGVVAEDIKRERWENSRYNLHLYTPDLGGINYSRHLDGRKTGLCGSTDD